jgi:hypothetical protein
LSLAWDVGASVATELSISVSQLLLGQWGEAVHCAVPAIPPPNPSVA